MSRSGCLRRRHPVSSFADSRGHKGGVEKLLLVVVEYTRRALPTARIGSGKRRGEFPVLSVFPTSTYLPCQCMVSLISSRGRGASLGGGQLGGTQRIDAQREYLNGHQYADEQDAVNTHGKHHLHESEPRACASLACRRERQELFHWSGARKPIAVLVQICPVNG